METSLLAKKNIIEAEATEKKKIHFGACGVFRCIYGSVSDDFALVLVRSEAIQRSMSSRPCGTNPCWWVGALAIGKSADFKSNPGA